MTTLCLADLDLTPCDKEKKPKGNTPSQLKLIQTHKAKPTEQLSSKDSSSSLDKVIDFIQDAGMLNVA
jgi:hypothetical protein